MRWVAAALVFAVAAAPEASAQQRGAPVAAALEAGEPGCHWKCRRLLDNNEVPVGWACQIDVYAEGTVLGEACAATTQICALVQADQCLGSTPLPLLEEGGNMVLAIKARCGTDRLGQSTAADLRRGEAATLVREGDLTWSAPR